MPRLALTIWRRFLKVATRINIAIYRATGGSLGASAHKLPIVLLTTTGRKSGKARTMPLAYIMDGENYIVAASFVGFGKKPGWFHNLKQHPTAMIQVKSARIAVRAEQASEAEHARLWAMLLQAEPGFSYFAARAKEPIPIMSLHPIRD